MSTEKKDAKVVKRMIGTMETTIVVCQCGHTKFNVQNRTKTAIALECAKCSNKTSVKGPVALAQVPEDEIAAAITDSVVRPDPDYEAGAPKDSKQSLADQGYTMLRFRVGLDAKENVVDKAMESVRMLQTGKAEYEDQTWQGHALEYICADFLGGVNPQVLVIVEEMGDNMKALAKQARAEGKKESYINRKLRSERQKARVVAAKELGIVEVDEPPEDEPPEDDSEPVVEHAEDIEENPQDPDGDTVKDGGRLKDCVLRVLRDYGVEYKEENGKDLLMLINVTFRAAMKRADKDGGFVIQVSGDERSIDKTDKRPVTYFWLEFEPENMSFDLDMEYEDAMFHNVDKPEEALKEPRVRADEIIPENISKAKTDWPRPTFCAGRIYMSEQKGK